MPKHPVREMMSISDEGRTAIMVNWRVSEPFDLSVRLQSISGWQVETIGGPFPRRITPVTKILVAWPAYFVVPLKIFIFRSRYKRVIAWQQVYGLLLAALLRFFRADGSLRICILSFIVSPRRRRGFFKSFINYALGSRSVVAAVCYNPAEVELNRTLFPGAASKIHEATLAEDIPDIGRFEVLDGGFFLAAGRSNRDYEFLVRVFDGLDEKLVIVCDDFVPERTLPVNVTLRRDCFGDDYLAQVAACSAVVLSFKDETMSAGQLVFLHAAQFGKPVIATRSHCLRGYIEDGVNGVICEKDVGEMKRRVASFRRSPDAAAMAERTRALYSEKFGFGQLARRIKELFNHE